MPEHHDSSLLLTLRSQFSDIPPSPPPPPLFSRSKTVLRDSTRRRVMKPPAILPLEQQFLTVTSGGDVPPMRVSTEDINDVPPIVMPRKIFDVPPPVPPRLPIVFHSGTAKSNLSACPPAPVLPQRHKPEPVLFSSHAEIHNLSKSKSSLLRTVVEKRHNERDQAVVGGQNSQEKNLTLSQAVTHLPLQTISPEDLVVSVNRGQQARQLNEYVDSPTSGPTNVTLRRNSEETDFVLVNVCTTLPSNTATNSVTSISDQPSKSLNLESVAQKPPEQCWNKIICPVCGKCRCSNCREPRQLPRRWIGEMECSPEVAVDCCTCMCCVRAAFYHCRRSEEDDFSDEPCNCDQDKCCTRWSLLGLFAICLPCLCCYWPLKCCLGICTSCYNACRKSRGCSCRPDAPSSSQHIQ